MHILSLLRLAIAALALAAGLLSARAGPASDADAVEFRRIIAA